MPKDVEAWVDEQIDKTIQCVRTLDGGVFIGYVLDHGDIIEIRKCGLVATSKSPTGQLVVNLTSPQLLMQGDTLMVMRSAVVFFFEPIKTLADAYRAGVSGIQVASRIPDVPLPGGAAKQN